MLTKTTFHLFRNYPNPNTFYENNPRFFYNYKNTLFTCTFKFSKVSHNTHELYTNKHIFHTNKIYLVLQVHELSQNALGRIEFPPKSA
jgi:hypothetical protein